MNDRLMKTEEEVRKRTKELLQMPPEDLITSYMFQEQEIERLKIIEEKYKDSQLYIKDFKDEIERLTLSYEDALEDLDKKESIIKEVKKWKEKLNNKKIIDLNWELEYLDEILDKGE